MTKLLDVMTERGITQKALASKAFVSTWAISRYAHGEVAPPVDVALLISRALNMTVEELFGDRV